MKINHKIIWIHLLSVAIFIIVSFIFFNPVLKGKVLNQSDLVQAKAMEHEREIYKEKEGKEIYWTNAAFGGMPTYLLGASYPNNYVFSFQKVFEILPRPVNFLFLYFLSFYILMLVIKIDWKLAILGSLAFGFSTYYIIIIGVGHLAKVRAIAFFPIVFAGIMLVFEQKKYLYGFALTTIALGLEIASGHYQMTYYLFFAVFFYGLFRFINAVKQKHFALFVKELSILLIAAILALGMNINHILPAREYVKESIRGKQILTVDSEGKPQPKKEGLDYDYITEYSYGFAETFNLFIPRFMGGSNMENLGEDSHLYKSLLDKTNSRSAKNFIKNVSTYWGKQPIVAAPAYIGATVIFFAVLSLFFYRGKHKNWIIAALILSLLLSWGKNFAFLTDFFINNIPLYNKFRTVASIQVIIEFLIPILAVMGLYAFFTTKLEKKEIEKKLFISVGILSTILLIFIFMGGELFTFESPNDGIYAKYGLLQALIEDRKYLLQSDSIRSLFFVLISAGILYLYLKNKIKKEIVFPVLIVLVLIDLAGVDKRYVNEDNFVDKDYLEQFFYPSKTDKEILKDKSYYRVIDFTKNPLTDGTTSYFHKQLGGYHAAKPRRIQDLFDFYLSKSINPEILNMYNVKYLIVPTEKNNIQLQINDKANGNAWFVSKIKFADNENNEILSLKNINTKETAVLNKKYKKQINNIAYDSLSQIKLLSYNPEKLVYESVNSNNGLAVFSENYYPHGWKADVDGKNIPIIKSDYSLRALFIPAGKHKITFEFIPEVVYKGAKLSAISYIIFILLCLFGLVMKNRKNKLTDEKI